MTNMSSQGQSYFHTNTSNVWLNYHYANYTENTFYSHLQILQHNYC